MQRYVKTSCMVKKILHTKKLFAEKYPWRIPYFRSSPPFRYWNWPPPPPSSSSLLLFTVFSLPPPPPSDLGIAPQLTSFSPQPNATFFWSKVFYFLKKLSMCRNLLCASFGKRTRIGGNFRFEKFQTSGEIRRHFFKKKEGGKLWEGLGRAKWNSFISWSIFPISSFS